MKIVLTNEDVKRVLKEWVVYHFGTQLCADNADEITFNDYALPWEDLKFERVAHEETKGETNEVI